MPGLASTLASLVSNRKVVAAALKAGLERGAAQAADGPPGRLRRVEAFGSNPGALEMFVHAPPSLARRPALVVVMHGCGQNAAGYDRGAGWSALADRHGFVLLFPQQTRANNVQGCFNWFQPGDIARGGGEALSVRQMVERAVTDHGIDRSRIFVTGLSAGGAMAAVMLATYPDVFAAGAVIAGLPYGTAATVQGALESMGQARSRSSAEWGDRVRLTSAHSGPWPKLSVWHGDADAVVKIGNATALAQQWTNLHGLPDAPTAFDAPDGHSRAVWRNGAGEAVVEFVTVAGMGHGTPLAVGEGEGQGGAAGAFMLDVGISSSHHIVRFFGLAADRPTVPAKAAGRDLAPDAVATRAKPSAGQAQPKPQPPAAGPLDWSNPDAIRGNVATIVGNALKSAGIVKP